MASGRLIVYQSRWKKQRVFHVRPSSAVNLGQLLLVAIVKGETSEVNFTIFDLLCLFWLLMTIKTLSVNSSEISWSDKLIICLENWGERIIVAMLNESTQRRLTTYRNSVNVQDIKKLQEKQSWYFVSSAQIRSRLMKSFKVPTLNRTSRKLKIDIHKINKNVLNSKSIAYTLNLCQPPWCMRNFCNFMGLFLHFFIFQELYPVGICDCRNLHG